MGVRPFGGVGFTPDCHQVEDIDQVRYAGGYADRTVTTVALTAGQAYALAADLLNQCVLDGLIENWGVSFAPDPVSVIRP
jgi:ABC-type uncharacterized transport system involved in gliding motility auxiliary subunit